MGWIYGKLLLVAGLTLLHHLMGRWRPGFRRRPKCGGLAGFYRVVNEVPTVLLIGIVVLVVVRPI